MQRASFRTILLVLLSVMIVGVAASAAAQESAGLGGQAAGDAKQAEGPILIAKRCFVENPGNACEGWNDPTPECPDTIIAGSSCTSVSFAEEGFSSSSSYQANCTVNVGTPDPEGDCMYTIVNATNTCKAAEGTACPASAETEPTTSN